MGRLLTLITVLASVQVSAFEDSRSYEDIIRELNLHQTKASLADDNSIGLADVRLHVGVGLVSSQMQLRKDKGVPGSTGLQGAEALVGIDLFSRDWLAEGAIRSYHREKFQSTDIAMREFDLRVVHEAAYSDRARLRIGGGVAARYLTFGTAPAAGISSEQTTPALMALVGFKYRVISTLEISGDLSYRSGMVSDTIDRRSLDGAIRLGGSF